LRRIGPSNMDDILNFKCRILDGIFHVHGSYHNTNEVVLDRTGYYQITYSNEIQNILKIFFEYYIVLFVNCGSGLENSNFNRLLKWARERQENIPNRYCILIRNGDTLNFRSFVPFRYGPNYQDLAPYFSRLLNGASSLKRILRYLSEDKQFKNFSNVEYM
jgi:hypothetical protein